VILGVILLAFALITDQFLTAKSRFEDECRARDA
jgi:hypothetical protein